MPKLGHANSLSLHDITLKTFSGGPLGTVMVMPVAGYFCDSSSGWPMAFYALGGVGFAWVVIWLLLGLDSPHQHKSITQEELMFIEDGEKNVKQKEVGMQPFSHCVQFLTILA